MLNSEPKPIQTPTGEHSQPMEDNPKPTEESLPDTTAKEGTLAAKELTKEYTGTIEGLAAIQGVETQSIVDFRLPRKRAHKWTGRKGEMVEEAIRKGMHIKVAAAKVGWNKDTVLAHMKARPEFMERLKRASADAHEFFLDKLREAPGINQWRAATWWFEHMFPELFDSKPDARIEHTLTVKVVSRLPRPPRALQDAPSGDIVDATYEVKGNGDRAAVGDSTPMEASAPVANMEPISEQDEAGGEGIRKPKAVRKGPGPADRWLEGKEDTPS